MARGAWAEAVEAFSAADRTASLAAQDLVDLATAAWWARQPDASTDALERAFATFTAEGRLEDAARVALWLAYQAMRRLDRAVGEGWLAHAGRLLDGRPESAGQAWLGIFGVIGELEGSRFAEASAAADTVMDVARRVGEPSVETLAMSLKGIAELRQGHWVDGQRLIDESSAAAMRGEIDPRVAGDIHCMTIAACRDIGDLERAGQWADESERWMRRQALGGYPGICRVHKAEIKMLRGHWPEAEDEATQACDELRRFGLLDGVGLAQYQVGEVRLRMGDLDGAEEAFDRAYEFGHDAQPGLALLQLARGDVTGASRSIARALGASDDGRSPSGVTSRAWLLPAQVEIAIAAGDLATAKTAVEELEVIAAETARPVFQAAAMTARGELLIGEGRPAEASAALGRSWRLCQRADLPYESARARLLYAGAVAAEGDTAAAERDLRAARAGFERLGASRDVALIDERLDPRAAMTPTTERATVVMMFTDIVTSTDLVRLIGDDAWVELLGWHDRELRAAFARARGTVVSHTGDGFFVTFDRAEDAIDCATDIQRMLLAHRRDHGFAPRVRIGLHQAEATRDGADYRGQGVHVAARIGAAADGDEVLASTALLQGIDPKRFRLSDLRTLHLKGVADPVEVHVVEWRTTS
ncbi:MAG: adenylate/guanylate cyclase domain-containing protein [Chloroflexota bacterium]